MSIRITAAAEALLEELAADPRGVAARLLADGAKTARPVAEMDDVPDSCPVALWLQRRTEQPWFVGRLFAGLPGHSPTVDLPPRVSAFVDAFDEGDHPELEGP